MTSPLSPPEPWQPFWRRRRALPLLALLGAGLILLHLTTFFHGERTVWLVVVTVLSDMLTVGAGIVLGLREAIAADAHAQRADQRTAQARAAAENVQARLAAVVDSAMDAIVTVDDAQKIVLFNAAAEAVFRCPREQALGTGIERFIPARYRAGHRDQVERFGATRATSRRMGDGSTLWAVRADGEEFPVESSISQTIDAGRRYYTVILRDVTLRKQADDALRRQQGELRELSARVFEAREEEKTLIARELHDELGQLLTALKMDLAWLRERLPPENAALAGKAQQMNALLDRTVGSVRRISAELRPLMLDDLGLADAAQWLVEDFGRRSGIEVRLDLDAQAGFDTVERPAATALYRTLQESLTNIARHSGAQRAWAKLALHDGEVVFEIEDDGRGIAAGDVAKPRSLGLRGMRERVHYLGGTLEVVRAPRGGTRVTARVPARAADAGASP